MRGRILLYATVLVSLVSLAAWILETGLTLPDASMIFLTAVIASAVWWGRAASVYTAFVSVLVYNYFFVEPIHTFRIARPADLLELLVFFGVAIITSGLATRARIEAEASERRAHQTAALLALSQQLASASGVDGVAQAVTGQVAQIMGTDAVLLMPEAAGGLPVLRAASPAEVAPPPDAVAAAWERRAAPSDSEIGGWRFWPLKADRSTLGHWRALRTAAPRRRVAPLPDAG
jgi:two-component system sensor histidine kinase KdpD